MITVPGVEPVKSCLTASSKETGEAHVVRADCFGMSCISATASASISRFLFLALEEFPHALRLSVVDRQTLQCLSTFSLDRLSNLI